MSALREPVPFEVYEAGVYPTQSFRTREPLRVVGEPVEWIGHSPEKLQAMRAARDESQRNGTAQIED